MTGDVWVRVEVDAERRGFRLSLDEVLGGMRCHVDGVPLLDREAVAEALREVAHRLDTGVGSADRT